MVSDLDKLVPNLDYDKCKHLKKFYKGDKIFQLVSQKVVYIVCIGVQPLLIYTTHSFFASLPLPLQTVQAPHPTTILGNPPSIPVLRELPPLKDGSFSEPQKY